MQLVVRFLAAVLAVVALAACSNRVTISLVGIERTDTYPAERYDFQMPVPQSAVARLGRQGFIRVVFRANEDLELISERAGIPAISYEVVDCAAEQSFRLTGDLFPIPGAEQWTYAAFLTISALPPNAEFLCLGLSGANMSGASVRSNSAQLPRLPPV